MAGTRGDALPAQWWTLYQDPELNRLVAAALRHNRDLAAADAHARALLGHLRGAQGERWPRTEVGYGYQYGRDGDDQTSPKPPTRTCTASGNTPPASTCPTSWTCGAKSRARIAAAKAECRSGASGARPARGQRGQPDHLAYVRAAARWRDGQTCQRRSVGLLDASLALSERQLAAGLSSELQRRRLLALRERTRAALPMPSAAARGTLRTGAAQRALAAPVGRSCRDLRRHTATAPCPAHRRRLEPAGAPPGRPRGRAPARRRRRPARAGRSRAVPAHQLRRRRRNLRSDPRRPRRQRRAGLRGRPAAELALPNRESARGRLDSAAAERDAALARFDGAVLGALREVERALALYAGERQRRADLQRALDEQRHAYRLARSNYRAGALDALELLDSQRSLVADRARLVDAEMRVAERQVELFRALGGGWQAAPSPSHQENGQ
ncbi:TolC family protein [Pseudomonas aeruginosa]|nr:TolC family protein [Pseudomonas aeruginosa]